MTEITVILRNTEGQDYLSYISFKIVPLCNYTLLSAILKALETFLEAILCKPFQLFRCILNDVNSIKKAPSPQC